MIQEVEITQSYKRLAEALRNAQEVTEHAIKTKAAVSALVAEATFDGRIDGKNEVARDAQARRLFADDYKNLDDAESWVRQVRHWVELQRLEVDAVRARLRLAEVLANAQAAAE